MSLTILPLGAGRLVNMPKPTVTFMRGWGQSHVIPMVMFVIEGAGAPIIVDTGPPGDIERVRVYHHYEMEQSEQERPEAVFAAAGVDPADVKLVINTHLHWDHCSNNALFPNATFLVQRQELNYASDPVEWHRPAYEKLPGIQPPWFPAWDRLHTVDGDVDVLPGIRLIALPGHTPGSQGVLVQTDAGPHLIAGDCIDTYENWDGDDRATHIPSGLYTDLLAYAESFRKIEGLGCTVIPSHDPAVLAHGRFG